MTFVILTGGIDLSVGSIVALRRADGGVAQQGLLQNRFSLDATVVAGCPVIVSVAVAGGIGLAAGLLQGVAITTLNVPPFVVTLGGLSAFRGAALLYFRAAARSAASTTHYRFWGQGKLGPVPVPVIIFLVAALLCHIVLRHTRYGRHVYAIGGNAEAARLSGLNVRVLTLSVYVIVGLFAGLAGFVLSSRLNSAEAVAGRATS